MVSTLPAHGDSAAARKLTLRMAAAAEGLVLYAAWVETLRVWSIKSAHNRDGRFQRALRLLR